MNQLTPQTQEQHDKAQQAGNAAYDAVFVSGRWSVRSAVEAYRAAYQASLAEQQNINCKRIIAVQHIDGVIEISDEMKRLHPLTAPIDATPSKAESEYMAQMYADDVRKGYIRHTEDMLPEAQAVADAKMTAFRDWQHGTRGAGCAGNSADEYDSSTEGHW